MSSHEAALAGPGRISSALLVALVVMTSPALGQPTDIRQFVHRPYMEGIPYEEVAKFDPDVAVPILVSMLQDPREERYWVNIVVTLGMLGDQRAVDPLIQFLEQDAAPRKLSPDEYRAKTSVPMVLGYIINKSGSRKALDYLKIGLEPAAWKIRNVRWTSPYHTSEDEKHLRLTKMAILGLGLSGDPAAAAALHALEQPATTAAGKRFQARISDVVAEALTAHERISKGGMANYYRKQR